MHSHRTTRCVLTLAMACTALGSLSAQGLDLAAPARARSAVNHVQALVVEHDGELRASGRDYKARFAEGVTFTPALGDAAPCNQDLHYDLRTIRRGDHLLFGGGGDSPRARPEQAGSRVRVELAPGLTERFDARSEGLEVSYEFAARPTGTGDLVVEAAIATTLQPAVAADGTLRFELPGVGGVTIGAVTGIDADGNTARGSMRFAGGTLQMRLPAEFVDHARYPLVLDPLLGTEFQIGANDDGDADVGYQHATGLYLVAWKRRFSAFDHDIYAQFVTPAGVPQGTTIWVDSTVDVSSRPRVGSVPTSNQYVVVYEKSVSPFGPFAVVCRTLQPNGTLGAIATIAPSTSNAHHAAVGSEITNADDEVLVAYQTSSGIEVREVTVPAAGALVVGTPLQLSTSPNAATPEISRSGGILGYWMAVWSDSPGLNVQIFGAVVDRTMALRATGQLTSNVLDETHPAVDGDGSTFVLAYQQQEIPLGANHDIRGARLQFTGSAITVITVDVPIEATAGQDERNPHTTWLGPKHCVVFEEQIGTTNTGIGAWLVDDTCVVCNTKIVLDGLNTTVARNREHTPRVGGRWQFALNGVYDDGLIVFTEADDVPPFTGSIVCQSVEALGPGTAAVQAGPGCGNGGNAFPGGGSPFVIGSQYFAFHVNGLEPSAVPFLSIGFPGPTLGCGACALTDPLSFRFIPNVGGAANSPYPVTCNAAFVGITFEFQWVSFVTSQSPCPSAPGLSASNRVRLTLSN